MRTITTLLLALLMSTMAMAQTAVHSVVYVEVKPSARAQAVAAFKSYATTARTHNGFAAIELYEQRGRPGHYVLIESWSEQGALDAQAAAQAALATALQPVKLSEIDRRQYKSLDTATAKAAGNKAVVMVAHVDAAPPNPAVTELLQHYTADSRQEAGNTRFDLLQLQQRPNHYTIVAAWRDDAALQAHTEADHTLRFRDQFGPSAGSPLDERLFEAVAL